jgi:hypothetical protein
VMIHGSDYNFQEIDNKKFMLNNNSGPWKAWAFVTLLLTNEYYPKLRDVIVT